MEARMTPRPTLSIIVPAHDVAPRIEACVGSALARLEARHALIVIDDGKTDRAPEPLAARAGPRSPAGLGRWCYFLSFSFTSGRPGRASGGADARPWPAPLSRALPYTASVSLTQRRQE
jgi:hypothetical protein